MDLSASEMVSAVVAVPITTKDRAMMAKALRMEDSAISLLKISIRSLPLARLTKLTVAMAIVLVLIPPPVDPGEAPIHMSIKTTRSEGSLNSAKSMVLKPAVLVVTDAKNADTHLPAY